MVGLTTAAVRAQDVVDEQDGQLWIQFNSQVPVAATWSVLFEEQPRWNQNVTHFDQVVLRAGIIKRLTASVQLSAAYAFVPRNTVIGTLYEHQTYEQALFLFPRVGKWTPSLRVREDQRYLPQWGDASHRLREQFRVSRPFPRRPDWMLNLYEEVFVNLDDTVRGPARGLDQVRFYTGLQHPLTAAMSVEVGYMWQEVLELGVRPHRRTHNAMVQLQYRPRGPAGRPSSAPLPPMPMPASSPTTE